MTLTVPLSPSWGFRRLLLGYACESSPVDTPSLVAPPVRLATRVVLQVEPCVLTPALRPTYVPAPAWEVVDLDLGLSLIWNRYAVGIHGPPVGVL